MIYKRFIFPQPSKDAHKQVVLHWIDKNRSIIAGPAKVGFWKDDHLKGKYSVVIPIRAMHLPALGLEVPAKNIFPISMNPTNLVPECPIKLLRSKELQ